MNTGSRFKMVFALLVLADVSCTPRGPKNTPPKDRTQDEAAEVVVLRSILDDVKNGDAKKQILQTFKLDQWPPSIVLQEPAYKSLGINNPLTWPQVFHDEQKMYPSLDAVIRDRALYHGPVLVVRLDRLGLTPTDSTTGNCRIVATIVNSDEVPSQALGLNYLAKQASGKWTAELVFLE